MKFTDQQRAEADRTGAFDYLESAHRAAHDVVGLDPLAMPLPVERVGIIGAGTMGGGIAMCFLSAGIRVTLVERDAGALDRGVGIIRRNYDASVAKGRMSADAVDSAMALLQPALTYQALSDCDLVIEAVYEEMTVKQDVFRTLDRIARPGAILATNTSYLDVDRIAAVTDRPQDVVGLHFFSPANIMKLLEIVKGARTSDQALATAVAIAERIGKVSVVAGVCHGFIGNRMLAERQREAYKLVLEGATPEQVDGVLTGFGFPMGPLQMADLAGLDLGWTAETSKGETLKEVLCEQGRRGQKTRCGFYDYDENRQRTASPEVADLIAGLAQKLGVERRAVSDEEILERCVYPMVNEGAKILAEGKAQSAGDIDVVWVNGYGWPRWRGGPMFWAEQAGLDDIAAALRQHAPALGPDFSLSPLLVDRASAGGGFAGERQPIR